MSLSLKDYILVLEDLIPSALCDQIINEYHNSQDWVNTSVARGFDREYRRCDAVHLSDGAIIEKNKPVRKKIDEELFKCAADAIKQYSAKFKEAKIEGDSGYTLLRYQENEFYKQHTDHFLQAPRIVSCSFALNDDYEGGEWGFFDRDMVVRAPKGSAVMFPSNFMYPHEIMTVTRGVRYSIITWFI